MDRTPRRPHARLAPVPVDSVRLTGGFWADRVEASRARGLPALFERLEEHGVLDNFRRKAGADLGRKTAFWFVDSDLYKWMEAAAWSLVAVDDPTVRGRLDEAVGLVVAAQEPDGYLNTFFAEGERFADLSWSHEMYCAGHLFQAAVAVHRATGDERLVEAAILFADLLCREFGPSGRPEVDGHPEVEMALVELARHTGETKYVELAAALTAGADLGSAAALWGHAVRTLYFACGLTDLAAETGEHRETLASLWVDLVERRSYVTGGVGGRWLGESAGRAYELPNEASYAETCAAVASAMWAWRMLLLTGEAGHADHLELVLHNAVLAGVSLDGDEWFYANPLATDARPEHDPWTRHVEEEMAGPFPLRRLPWRDVTCCPPNVLRLMASLPGTLYSLDGDDLWVQLFAASHVTAGGWDVEQHTAWPWDGRVELEVRAAPPGETALVVRAPGWCAAASVGIEGEAGRHHIRPGTFHAVRRRWSAGDRLVMELPMPPEALVCNPRVAENRGSVAVRRGPLVYCFEGADNVGVDVLSADLDPGSLEAGWSRDVLGGIVTVTGRGSVPVGPWGRLYRPFADRQVARRALDLVGVPYYLWANRGLHPMSVWMASSAPVRRPAPLLRRMLRPR